MRPIAKGERFNRLTALTTVVIDRRTHWLCFCDCGRTAPALAKELRRGRVGSCGCYQRESSAARFSTHGMSGTRVHNIWNKMRRRCEVPACREYRYYGARGITVSPEWHDFGAFMRDMGAPPSQGHTLERIDNDAAYCRENCRWATMAEQNRNKRNSYRITAFGETRVLSEWSSDPRAAVSREAIKQRIVRGWEPEAAITTSTLKPSRREHSDAVNR